MTAERFVVTGPGRCGTGWWAAALNGAGLTVGHEAVYDHDRRTAGGARRWAGYDGDSALAAQGYAQRLAEDGVARALVSCRDPLLVVASWAADFFFADSCPHPDHDPGAHTCTPYFRWMAERLPGLAHPTTGDEAGAHRALLWVEHAYRRALRLGRFGVDVAWAPLAAVTADAALASEYASWLAGRDVEVTPPGRVNQHVSAGPPVAEWRTRTWWPRLQALRDEIPWRPEQAGRP